MATITDEQRRGHRDPRGSLLRVRRSSSRRRNRVPAAASRRISTLVDAVYPGLDRRRRPSRQPQPGPDVTSTSIASAGRSLRRVRQRGRRQADRAAGKACRVEITRRSDRLHIENRDSRWPPDPMSLTRLDHLRHGAVRQCFGQDAADQLALVGHVELHHLRDGAARHRRCWPAPDRRNCDLKSGPCMAMKFQVSARLNEPCMPWPCCSIVSATSTVQRTGSPHTVSKERKLTAIAGCGVIADAFERDVVERQRAGEFAELGVDEKAADIVFASGAYRRSAWPSPCRRPECRSGRIRHWPRPRLSACSRSPPIRPLPNLVCWPSATAL